MSSLLRSVQIFPDLKGAHDPDLSYKKFDEVQHQTSIYVAAEDIPAGTEITDPRWVVKLDNSAAYAAEQAREEAEALRVAADAARMRFVPKGPYIPTNENKYGEWYTHEGGSYGYIYPTPSTGVPVTDTTHWQQIASQGDKGDKGDAGAKIVTAEWSGDDMLLTLDDTSAVTLTGAKTTLKGDPGDIINIKVDGANKTKAAGVVDLTSDFARYALCRKTPSGNPVSAYPVPESPLYPKVSGTFTQSGTGDPSPANIRPITPWLASGGQVRVKRTGKNLVNFLDRTLGNAGAFASTTVRAWDETKYYIGVSRDNYYYNTGTFSISGTTISFTGPTTGYGLAFPVRIKPSTTYTWSVSSASPNPFIGCGYYTSEGVFISAVSQNTSLSFSVTTPANAGWLVLNIAAGTTLYTHTNLQLELGSVATPYEPYTESEITLTAPQEIPAGWMDCEEKGSVTGIKATLNGSETWDDANFAASGYFGTTLSVVAHGTPGLACSHFLPAASAATDSNKAVLVGTSLKIYPADAVATNKTAWLAWLVANPVTIAYTRATPASITPTAAPLAALPQLDRVTPRQNVLTASTGSVELTYAKSPIREADELAAAIALL